MGVSELAAVNAGWYRPVTVVTGSRRVDLALPRTVPVGELLPQLLALCQAPSNAVEPVRWALIRLDGRELGADRCLDDVQVADGEVLTLHARPTTVRPAYVEDVRDLVEDTVTAAGGHWTSRTTMGFTLLAGAAALAAVALLPLWAGMAAPVSTTAVAAAVVALAGSVAAAWWATRRHHRLAAYGLAATACLWGGGAGFHLAGWWELADAPTWGVSGVGLLAGAAAVRLVTRHAAAHLAATAVLAAVAAAVAVPAAAGTTAVTGVRVAAPLLVLAIGIVPRIALTAGGLGLADYRVRLGGRLSPAAVSERLHRSDELLIGTLVGLALAAAGLGLALAAAPAAWDRWLGGLVGLALLLRSRVFSRTRHVTPLRLAGALVLSVQLGHLGYGSAALSGWLPALVVAIGLVLVGVSAVALSDISRARVKQLLDMAELLVVAAIVPVAVGAAGGYRFAAGIIG